MRWSKTVVVATVFDQRIFLKLFGGIRSTID